MYLFYDLFRRDPHVRDIEQGEFLFREGDHSEEEMYVLVSGVADVLVGDRVVEEARPGAILGEMALIERREARTASVLARTRCGFVVINKKRFHYLVTEMPQFAIEVMRVLADRLRNTDQAIALQGRPVRDTAP